VAIGDESCCLIEQEPPTIRLGLVDVVGILIAVNIASASNWSCW